LARPGSVGLPVALALLTTGANRSGPGPYQKKWPVPVGSTALALTLLMLLPWGYRNYRVLGRIVFTSTNSGFTLYDGFNPDASGASDQDFVRQMPQLKGMNEL